MLDLLPGVTDQAIGSGAEYRRDRRYRRRDRRGVVQDDRPARHAERLRLAGLRCFDGKLGFKLHGIRDETLTQLTVGDPEGQPTGERRLLARVEGGYGTLGGEPGSASWHRDSPYFAAIHCEGAGI